MPTVSRGEKGRVADNTSQYQESKEKSTLTFKWKEGADLRFLTL